jgi:2-oxoglutarate dehydrogenase E1 component
VEWRQKFAEDCIIDLVCYRRYGHNELDQPLYTQPLMYSKIMKHPDTLSVFESQMLRDKVADAKELNEIKSKVSRVLESDLGASKTWVTPAGDWLSSKWAGFKSPHQRSRVQETGVAIERLRDVGLKMTQIPANFAAHKQLQKIFAAREESIRTGEGIDWATAEALAFGTLLREGNHVRLSGQDVQRGTFSHRHAVLLDQKTGASYTPLNSLCKTTSPTLPLHKTMHSSDETQAEFHAHNSILSEFGVLGFEMGFSLENPNALSECVTLLRCLP